MTDDLVKRLREEATADTSTCSFLTEEAADRIEKLEAALREIAEQAEDDFASANDMGWTARKALEGKDDVD